MSTLPAVLFDADGVLQHAHHDWAEALDAVGREGFASVVFAHELPAMRGEATMRDCLAAAAEAHGVVIDLDGVLELWRRFDVDDEALAIVADVRRAGHAVHLATNQQDVRRDVMSPRYAGVFDEEFYSCELGACKPSTAFFERMLARLGLEASGAVFVDDSPRNVEAAASCGMTALLHEPSSGPDGLRGRLAAAGVQMCPRVADGDENRRGGQDSRM